MNTPSNNALRTTFCWLLALTNLLASSCASSGKGEWSGKTVRATEILRLIDSGQPVIVRDCTVEGDLDFTKSGIIVPLSPYLQQVQVGVPVYFEGCHFKGNIIGADMKAPVTANFRFPVSFHRCQVDGEVDFSGASFAHQLSLSQSYFEKGVKLQAARIEGDLRFEETIFNEDFLMQEAVVRGTFWGKDATLLGQFSVQQSDFWQHVVLTGISVHGYSDMTLANFRRSAFFGYGKYYDRVACNGARFSERAEWTNAEYAKTLSFDGVKFDDTTELTGLNVKGGLTAAGTRFERGQPDLIKNVSVERD